MAMEKFYLYTLLQVNWVFISIVYCRSQMLCFAVPILIPLPIVTPPPTIPPTIVPGKHTNPRICICLVWVEKDSFILLITASLSALLHFTCKKF